MFYLEAVEACFEASENMTPEFIIEQNKKLIAEIIAKINDFKNLVKQQLQLLTNNSNELIDCDFDLVQISVEEGMRAAIEGIDNFEKQVLPLKNFVLKSINFADGAESENIVEDKDFYKNFEILN